MPQDNTNTPPMLGYDKPSEQTLDQVNTWMRSQPWYQEQMRQWGQDSGHPKLAKSQRDQILRLAQAHGVIVNEGDQEVDAGGNLDTKGHNLRNALIAGGIGAGAFFGAPALAGLLGGGGAGAGAAGLGAVETATPFGVGGLTATSLGLPITAGLGTTGAAAATSGAGSVLSRLLGGNQPGSNLGDLSKVLGGFSSGEKANRLSQGEFAQGYDRNAINAEQNRNAATNAYNANMLEAQTGRNQTESDALTKLAVSKYLMGGGSQFTPPALSIGGKSYAPMNMGYGPTPTSEAQKQGASTLQDQLVKRLAPGGTYAPQAPVFDYKPQPLSGYAQPGTAEKLGSWGGVMTGGLGALRNIWGS